MECTATFTPGKSIPFDVTTSVDFTPGLGKQTFLPLDAIPIGKMSRDKTVLPFILTMEKQNRAYLLSFIPTGLGASFPSDKAQGSYLQITQGRNNYCPTCNPCFYKCHRCLLVDFLANCGNHENQWTKLSGNITRKV
ncbi:MAG: hypothetical protein J7L95_05580 [Prolixibacteraceae bacterium]|nr:hypothetical protein [Prolixibacteraceae bacterium]